mmetsp:Transcript_20135/g.62271  ORF Transcript_20135/g.62271 Transcript_20135/m.62271 type:complete len:257 (+) Transcript_20135:447-1217(+)
MDVKTLSLASSRENRPLETSTLARDVSSSCWTSSKAAAATRSAMVAFEPTEEKLGGSFRLLNRKSGDSLPKMSKSLWARWAGAASTSSLAAALEANSRFGGVSHCLRKDHAPIGTKTSARRKLTTISWSVRSYCVPRNNKIFKRPRAKCRGTPEARMQPLRCSSSWPRNAVDRSEGVKYWRNNERPFSTCRTAATTCSARKTSRASRRCHGRDQHRSSRAHTRPHAAKCRPTHTRTNDENARTANIASSAVMHCVK